MLILQHGIVNYGGGAPPPTGDTTFKFVVTTTYGGQSITIPHVSGYIYNYIVDYGDGTVLPVTSYNDPNCTHVYTSASAHTISISGICETFYCMWSGTMPSTLTKILQWGDVGFRDFRAFGCQSLTEVPSDNIGGLRRITNFQYFLAYTGIVSIPAGLFDSATGATRFDYTFYGCQYLTNIPADLFRYNTEVTAFNGTFYVGYLTSIPHADMFKYNTKVTDFNSVFSNWYALTSIPADLFKYNTGATTFNSSFSNCYQLSGISANLFKYNTLANNFQYCFQQCSNLLSVPNGLFSGCTSATNFTNTFSYCYQLTTLGNLIFPVSANYFYQTFYQCANLTSVPAGLFTGCTSAYNFYQTFYQCTHFYGALPSLWTQFPTANGTECFAGDTNASNYSLVPEEWGGLPVNLKLEVTTTGVNQTITIPHLTGTGYTHNYFIEYGDGYSYTITGATDPNCTHIYSSASVYTIKIRGICETFFMTNADTMFTGLTKVLAWGSVQMKKMNFSGSTILTSIASSDPMYGLSGVTDFINVFAFCSNLEEAAPALWNLYSGKTGTNCFTGDTNLYNYSYIPTAWGGLGGTPTPLQFEVNIPYVGYGMYLPLKQKNYANTYTYNFDFDVDWGDGTGIFHVSSYNDSNTYHSYVSGGTNIISISGICETIDAWQGNNTYQFQQVLKKIIQWGQVELRKVTFMSCQYLTDVTATDVQGVSLITDWSYGFYNCTTLSGLTAGMFSGFTKVTTFFGLFTDCHALATIPAGMFDGCVSVTNMAQAFYYCYNLTSIPAGLFDSMTGSTVSSIDFSYCFYYCVALTGAAPELWLVPSPPSLYGSQCFGQDTGLTNYATAQSYGWA
jgi:hypothetical protein